MHIIEKLFEKNAWINVVTQNLYFIFRLENTWGDQNSKKNIKARQ
jgi:hypothetical protein